MFSEKYGYTPEKTLQHECISNDLRRRIWNLFYQEDVKHEKHTSTRAGITIITPQTIEEKIADKMGYLIDEMPAQLRLKENITLFFEWYEVYNFIDIHISFLKGDERIKRIKQYNEILEQEKAGYRIIAGEIAPITNKLEIQCIENAANTPYKSVDIHIQKALALYADIKSPDYENSVKESISAVESMCRIITGMPKATLGEAMKKFKEKGVHIHRAMESAFSALYGYTSDADGIRHGGIDFTNAPPEDAKYMLVSCSAFVNYLIEKWGKVEQKE